MGDEIIILKPGTVEMTFMSGDDDEEAAATGDNKVVVLGVARERSSVFDLNLLLLLWLINGAGGLFTTTWCGEAAAPRCIITSLVFAAIVLAPFKPPLEFGLLIFFSSLFFFNFLFIFHLFLSVCPFKIHSIHLFSFLNKSFLEYFSFFNRLFNF